MANEQTKIALGARVAQARSRAKLTQAALGRLVGMNQSAIAHLEKGKVDRPKKLREIAKELCVSEQWLLGETPNSRQLDEKRAQKNTGAQDTPLSLLQITGYVRAGTWQEVDMMGQDDHEIHSAAPDPRFPTSEQFLLRVRGDSMNAATPAPILDGYLLKCVSFAAWATDLREGQTIIVHRIKDQGGLIEATVKKVSVDAGDYVFYPQSTNPAHRPIRIPKNGDSDREEVQVIGIVLDIIIPLEE